MTLLALADYCRPENGTKCWPSIQTLAEMVGTSERQIKRNLAALEESGELVILRNVGRSNTNLYDLSPLKGDIDDIKGDTDDTIYETEKVTSRAEKVTSRVIKGDMDVTRSVITVSEPEEEDNAIDSLADWFADEAGIFGHRRNYDELWAKPLAHYLERAGDVAGAKALVERGLQIARGDNEGGTHYRITSPASLSRIIANMNGSGPQTVKHAEGGGIYV